MQLGDLKTQFKGLLNNTIVNNNSALVTTFVNQSILRIQRELRVPFMEKTVLYTIPPGYTMLAIPSDLLELIDILVDSDGDGVLDYPLQRAQLRDVAPVSQQPGIPRLFCRKGAWWLLGPTPSAGDKVEITYHAEFAPLVADTDENTLSKIAWDAILYGALSAACDYLTDDRMTDYEGRYTQILTNLQNQADGDELSADAAVRPCLTYDDGCG